MAGPELKRHVLEFFYVQRVLQHAFAQHRYMRRFNGLVQHDKAVFAHGAHGHLKACVLEVAVPLFSFCQR